MSAHDVLPEIVVLVAALAGLLMASFISQPRQWLGAPLALCGLLASGVACTMQLGAVPRLTFAATWALDGGSAWTRLSILAATSFAVLLAPDWLRNDRRHGEYYPMLLLSALGAMVMAGAADTLQLVMGILLSSVTGYVLAAYHRDWAPSVEAGMKYFLVGALANTLMMVGVAVLFGLLGDTSYAAMAGPLAQTASSPALLVGLALVVIGLSFKLGAVPAYAWMPDVAEGAPAPAAAFLTVVPKLGAALALARLLQVFPVEIANWHPLIATLAAATMTLGNLAALGQTDVRRIVGWSSVSQSGYALMAVAVVGLSSLAIPALLFFLAGYAVANLAVFAVITHLRGRTAIEDYRGLGASRPWTSAMLVVGFLSLIGIPPLAGFVGKLTLFLTTIDAGYTWLAVVALVNTVVSVYYYLKVISAMYFAPQDSRAEVLGRWSAAAMGLAAGLVVLIGIASEGLMRAFGQSSLLP